MTAQDRSTGRAAYSIGWQIMLASAVIVIGIILVAILYLTHQARPSEQLEQSSSATPHVYVDLTDTVQGIALIGAGAIVFAGLVSLVIARRAVKPLGEALRLQRQFVADAGHELRTPLAVLDARLQVVERRLGAGTPVSPEALAELRADSRSLIEIVDDLLLAAGGEGTPRSGPPIDAAAVAAEAVDSLRILAAERDVTLSLHASMPRAQELLAVRIPPTSFRRSVVALVDNAVAHSPAGGTVRVALAPRGKRVELTVSDDGPGIVGIDPSRVFERFAHSGPVAAGAADGHAVAAPGGNGSAALGAGAAAPARASFGLGLALVRDIATRYGGSVEVVDTSSAGTTFRLLLPAAPTSPAGRETVE